MTRMRGFSLAPSTGDGRKFASIVLLMMFRFLYVLFIGPAFLHPPRGDPICRHTWFHEPFLSRKYSGGIRVRFGLLHRVISTVRRRVPDPNCRDCPGVEIPSALLRSGLRAPFDGA